MTWTWETHQRVRPLYVVLRSAKLSRCYGLVAIALFSAQSVLCLALCFYLVYHPIYVPYFLSCLLHCTILDLLDRIIWYPMTIDDCAPINALCVSVPNPPSDDCIKKVAKGDTLWQSSLCPGAPGMYPVNVMGYVSKILTQRAR